MCSPLLYSKIVTPSRKDSANFLNEYIHLLKWNDHKEEILDFGCGDGFVTRQILYPNIKKYTNTLLGIDISKSLLNVANYNNNILNLDFKFWDMNNNDNTDEMANKFDHIFSFYCMHWIPDQRTLIRALHKMLKPNGQIFATLGTQCSLYDTLDIDFKNSSRWSKYLPRTNWFANYTNDPVKYMRNLLEEAGFVVDLCEVKTLTQRFIFNYSDSKSEINCTVQDFCISVISMHPYLKYIPTELQMAFIKEFVEATQKSCISGKNKNECFWPYKSLVLIASKK